MAVLDAVPLDDADVAANLGAAAHLIHGSSEGRFRIVYCTDPASGGLSGRRDRIGGLRVAAAAGRTRTTRARRLTTARLAHAATETACPFHFIANPALGLWAAAERI